MTCSVAECDRAALVKGFCNKHYQRWIRHGDPLGGTTDRGEAHRFFTDVVLQHETDDCLIWPYVKASSGYGQLRSGGRMMIVSRMVCEDIHGPAPTDKHEAAHSCGNGHLACVTKRHLRWATPTENMADKVVHGTQLRGERHLKAKLKEVDVREIRRLRRSGTSALRLASRFKVTERTIFQIAARETWGWLEDKSPTTEAKQGR